MQKMILKVYIEGMRKPLIEADIIDEENKILEDLKNQLNSTNKIVIFDRIAFKKDLFRYYTIEYK